MIGDKIKRWRSFRGIKQESFATTVGVSRVTLSKYENGRSEISLSQLSVIARALEIGLDDLIAN
jgi:transcriptional regulator with XRE-family HTH domain